MLSPDSVQRSKPTWSLDVSNQPNNHHRRCLNDGNSLAGFLLVKLCKPKFVIRNQNKKLNTKLQKYYNIKNSLT
ncbi:hypothetical protein Hanom_Chr10g00875931 [Helianthus anomalus]